MRCALPSALPVCKLLCISVERLQGYGPLCFLLDAYALKCHPQIWISPLVLNGSSVLHSPSAQPGLAIVGVFLPEQCWWQSWEAHFNSARREDNPCYCSSFDVGQPGTS